MTTHRPGNIKSQLFRKFQILTLLSLFAFSGGANICQARTQDGVTTEWVFSHLSKIGGRFSFNKTTVHVCKNKHSVSFYKPELNGIVFVHNQLTRTRLTQVSKVLFSGIRSVYFVSNKIIPQNHEEEFPHYLG